MRDEPGEIFYNADIGNVEYGGMGVGVDGDNEPGVPHAADMLTGTGDAAGDIKLRPHGSAGDTPPAGCIPAISCRIPAGNRPPRIWEKALPVQK